MSMLRSFATQKPAVLLRDVILVALVLVVAIIATIAFSGPGQPLSFNVTIDPLRSYPW